MKTITIHISPIGDVDIEADGFNGVGCKDATKGYEEEFGGDTVSTPKPELHNTIEEDSDRHIQSGGGITSID